MEHHTEVGCDHSIRSLERISIKYQWSLDLLYFLTPIFPSHTVVDIFIGGVYPTWWESVIDVKSPVYYFNWLETPNVIWVELAQVDFDTLDEYLYLRPQDMSLVADVTCDFVNDDGAKYCSGADEESAANDRAIAVASTLLLVIASTMMM